MEQIKLADSIKQRCSGAEAIDILMTRVYRYHSIESKKNLEKLHQRLLAEQLLARATMRDIINWFERYSENNESLDNIVAYIKHPGKRFDYSIADKQSLRISSVSLLIIKQG